MKTSFNHRFLSWLALSAGVCAMSPAATLSFWNFGGSGGDGNWGTGPGDKNWHDTPGGALSGNTIWPDTLNDVAVFQDDTGGIVTVFDPVQTAGIVQNGADYTLNAGTITLLRDSALTAPFVDVQSGALSIDSILAGGDGLRKTGGGNLLLSGDHLYTGTTAVDAGTLTLNGNLTSVVLDIAAGATLLDQSGGLAATTVLTNAGTLTMGGTDTIASYHSNGGTLAAGPGTLTATSAHLNSGTTLAGGLVVATLISNGAVAVSGSAQADVIQLASGTLTNTGTLGTTTSHLDLAGTTTLVAGGIQRYALLTTSGAGSATWQGNLIQTSTLAPGGAGGFGALTVTGTLANAPGATLQMDISATSHDGLLVGGPVSLGGALNLNQVGPAGLAPLQTINLIAAPSFSGTFASFSENLDGEVWFNPRNGNLTALGNAITGTRRGLFGAGANPTSTWVALYDDVIEPGVTNIIYPADGSGYQISGGLADASHPDLLWALTASTTPGGLDIQLLNRLSPEVYAGLEDYALLATRNHQRAAMAAPALAPRRPEPAPPTASGSKGAAKDALAPAAAALVEWEFFAALDTFNVRSHDSRHDANYELSGAGVIAGLRTQLSEQARLAVYFAGNDGELDGSLIDADADGWSLGVIGEVVLDAPSHTVFSVGLSYGQFSFDGSRGSAAADASGWSPGRVDFRRVDSDALEVFVGLDGVAYHNERFRLIPSLSLRYASGSLDSFTESSGSLPGSPLALAVGEDHYHSALAEIALLGEFDLTPALTLWGQLGASGEPGDSQHSLTARFAQGSRTMQAQTDGLSNDLTFLALGARFQATDSFAIAFGYRAEFRSGAGHLDTFTLSSSLRF